MALAAITMILAVLPGLNQTAIALTLVLLVIVVAVTAGRGPALYVSIFAGLVFNYFFIGPTYSFQITRAEDVVALLVFVLTAVVVGQLSSRLEKRSLQAEELRRSEQLKTALLDAVTHDLRTPLTSIKGAISTIRDEGVSAEVRQELCEVIDQEADRLNHFIQGMMDLARLEAGQLSLESRNVSAEEMVEDALHRAEPLLASHRVEVSIEPQLPELRVDPRLISQVLYTLIENAAKYSGAGTRIGVSVRRNSNSAVDFAVTDDGPGIAPELRAQVFQKFFRAGSRPGFGVGLTIARGIVQAHGGVIHIADGEQGQGCRVHFQIPCGARA
jgi:two-component system sensor histidine kinase KdpD